jgi:hypothetical protein
MTFDELLDKGNNFIVGWLLAGLFSISYWTYTDTYQSGQHSAELMKACQSKLPRDEFCVIVAVPSKEG